MSTRTRKFASKVYQSYAVVEKRAVREVATFLRNRHISVRTTPGKPAGYREVWVRPPVKNP